MHNNPNLLFTERKTDPEKSSDVHNKRGKVGIHGSFLALRPTVISYTSNLVNSPHHQEIIQFPGQLASVSPRAAATE